LYETTCLTCTETQKNEIEEIFGQEGKKKVEEEKRKIRKYLYIGVSNRSVYERGLEHQNDITACTYKLGERDLDKWREDDRKESEKEATIVEKIRMRKKERKIQEESRGRKENGEMPASKEKKERNETDEEDRETAEVLHEEEGKEQEGIPKEDPKEELRKGTPMKRRVQQKKSTTTSEAELHQDPQEEQDGGLAGGEISCDISMQDRMPTSNVWASSGGITPLELNNGHILTPYSFMEK
jgi:hypothetical protein